MERTYLGENSQRNSFRYNTRNVPDSSVSTDREYGVSRQQRVMEARAAFHREEQVTAEPVAIPGHFGLLRFMASLMLLLVLMAAFANDFSYHGFDRQYVQECLADESRWQALEQKVQNIYMNIRKDVNK